MQRKNPKLIQGVDFELIENLPNNGTKYLLIFDDSCEEISNSQQFVKVATAGRHRGLNTIYIKHNFFHQSKLGRDVELQNTHIALFKSPRDVLQINTLSKQLGLGSQLKEWYQDATSTPYGHLLIDLTPKTVDSLKYCTNSGSVPSKFYLPAATGTKFLNDEHTIRLYTPNGSNFFSKTSKTIHPPLSKKFHSIPQRMFSKLTTRQAKGSSKSRHSKISKKNIRTHTKKNFVALKENYFELARKLTINICYHSFCQ